MFDKISYDVLQFRQIEVQNSTKAIKHEHNIVLASDKTAHSDSCDLWKQFKYTLKAY